MKKPAPELKSAHFNPFKLLAIAAVLIIIAVVAVLITVFIERKSAKPEELDLNASFQVQGEAVVYSPDGKEKTRFELEIADTPEKQQRGLMYRDSLGVNQAMLFLYEKPDYISFWMKNTYISLDIIFCNEDGKIISISRDTTPFSEEQLMPPTPAKFALETPAGSARRFGLEKGDKVRWSYLQNKSEKESTPE